MEKPVKDMIINGKIYPMWQQFVERQNEWIGGILEDEDADMETTITNITLEANGTDSAFFRVRGETFGCGFDVHYGVVIGGEEGWLTFSGYGGHTWRIKQP